MFLFSLQYGRTAFEENVKVLLLIYLLGEKWVSASNSMLSYEDFTFALVGFIFL